MNIPTEVIYDEGAVSRVQLGLRTWKALTTGTITEMHLWIESTTNATKFFNVRKNGVNLFSNSQRFSLTSSVFYEAKTGLSIPITFGDELALDFVRSGLGIVQTPITFLMVTEE
jgi:hypothetical protein